METGPNGENTALSLTHLHSLGLDDGGWEEQVTDCALVYSLNLQIPSPLGVPKSDLDWQIWLNDDQIKSENSFAVLKVPSF